MATEFPIDPEYGRFIEGMTAPEDEGLEVEIPEEDTEIEELPDGSAIVKMENKGPEEDEDFYASPQGARQAVRRRHPPHWFG